METVVIVSFFSLYFCDSSRSYRDTKNSRIQESDQCVVPNCQAPYLQIPQSPANKGSRTIAHLRYGKKGIVSPSTLIFDPIKS